MKTRFLTLAVACLLCLGQVQAKVNVNTATLDELETLDGIGAVRAQAIVDYRQQNGPLKSIRDLRKVPDIPTSVIEGLKGQVSYSGPTKIAGDERKRKAAGEKPEQTAPAPARAAEKPARPMALPPPVAAAKQAPAAPASPAKPLGEVKAPTPAVPAVPAAIKPAAPAAIKPAAPAMPAPAAAAPAKPAMPGKPAAPVPVPDKLPAAEKAPAMPAGPAKPARPAMPAAVN